MPRDLSQKARRRPVNYTLQRQARAYYIYKQYSGLNDAITLTSNQSPIVTPALRARLCDWALVRVNDAISNIAYVIWVTFDIICIYSFAICNLYLSDDAATLITQLVKLVGTRSRTT